MNPWAIEAYAAVADYAAGRKRGEYPVKPEIGLCQRASRCLYRAVMGKVQPWARGTASDSMRAAILAGRAIEGDEKTNAYHKAAAKGKITPGTELYFGGNGGAGHTCVVVDVTGDPATDLKCVRVFENTSAGFPRGPGTVVSLLSDVCGPQGSDRVEAVVHVELP